MLQVNKLYTHLEIEVDGIFAAMLLLKKKKYAALVATEGPGGTITVQREMKGLDMVRASACIALAADQDCSATAVHHQSRS